MGKAIAVTFAGEGAAVAVVARSESRWDPRLPGTVHETVAAIESSGGRALAVPADLSRPEDVERVVETTRAAFGRIDVLVNNAALTVPGRPPTGDADAKTTRAASAPAKAPASGSAGFASFLNFPLKGFRMHFEIGLFACYRLMQLVVPDMVAAGRGSIINISSLAAWMPGEGPYLPSQQPGPFAYGGNKAALNHLTQCVAAEMQAHGIVVNVLSPSEPILTPGNLVAVNGETDWASPDDFAEATVRLALADPTVMSGQLLWSEDVLHPELGRRGWLRPTPGES